MKHVELNCRRNVTKSILNSTERKHPHKNAPTPTHPHTHTHNHKRHLDPLIEASDVDAIAAHVSFEDIPLNLFRKRAQSLDELRHPRKRKSKDRLPK